MKFAKLLRASSSIENLSWLLLNTGIFLWILTFKNTYLKNICERLFLNVAFNRNEEQQLFAKLDEMGYNIIKFYIYSYHFGIIRFVFYPEAVVGCFL